MKRYINRFFLCLLTILLFIFASTSVKASAGLGFSILETVEAGYLSSDSNYYRLKAKATNDSGAESLQQVSYVKTSLDDSKLVVHAITGKNGIIPSNVIDIAKDYEKTHKGYKVIAAINGCYFAYGSQYQTVNACIADGTYIRGTNNTKYLSIGFKEDFSSYKVSKQNTVSTQYYLTIYDKDNLSIIKEIMFNGQNIMPSTNSTTFYYNQPAVLADGVTAFEMLDPVNAYKTDNYYFYGNITSEVSSVSINPTICTQSKEIIDILSKNPIVKISKKINGDNLEYSNFIGIGSWPLEDSVIKESEDIGDQNLSFCTSRQPRTTFGFDSEGNVVLCAIDGRQENMSGVSLREEAYIMKCLGCTDCFNLDGGGSTELAIRKDDDFIMLNTPCEVPYRVVTDALLLCIPITPFSFEEYEFEDNTLNFKLNSDDFNVYLNGEKEIGVNKEYSINIPYSSSSSNFITITTKEPNEYVIKYIQFGETKETAPEKEIVPSNFDLTITKEDDGLHVLVTYDDPSNLISMVYLYDQYGNKYTLSKSQEGHIGIIPEDEDYTFTIRYKYKEKKVRVVEKTWDETFEYISDNKDDGDGDQSTTIEITTTNTQTTTVTTTIQTSTTDSSLPIDEPGNNGNGNNIVKRAALISIISISSIALIGAIILIIKKR